MAGSLALKNDVQLVTQLPQSRRQVHDVLSAAESVPPISDYEVTCGPTTRPATLSSSATSSSSELDGLQQQQQQHIPTTYTSGSAARHPSLYLALRARPWFRMSQSYDLSDVDTTLMLFAAATVCRRTESWQ